MKNAMKKLIVLTLIAISLFALAVPASASTASERLEFYPTTIVVQGTTVTVQGYFENYKSYGVKNFKDFTLWIYQDAEYIFDAYFGDLNEVNIRSNGRYYCTLTIYNVYGLNSGTYNCSRCGLWADFDCNYDMYI